MALRIDIPVNLKLSVVCGAINFLAGRIDRRDRVWNILSRSDRELSSIRWRLCNLSIVIVKFSCFVDLLSGDHLPFRKKNSPEKMKRVTQKELNT